ncbi:two-component system, OmpR family, sensor histidine kinase ChvG [Tropicimonas isoalkanivorans]|uniref:histidine kinase n=1 Tax=Tropicimonas isoalkanivorans TaxID=441112 RepID=A0A1I1PI85_9RHOB|nr:sensor histidine kinase [Tropicimonas isoalkanivorans]SFD07388.1 two-component system, OmpR family, sensor histidine kinase ChvG [Tropicimonas isoalkanivorans]
MRDNRGVVNSDVVLGEDWVSPEASDADVRRKRERRGYLTLNRSPLARKIITFNLIGLLILVGGVFYLNPFRDSLTAQRVSGLNSEAGLIANVFEAQMPRNAPVSLASGDGINPQATLDALSLSRGVTVFVYDGAGQQVANRSGPAIELDRPEGGNIITGALNSIWNATSRLLTPGNLEFTGADGKDLADALVPNVAPGTTPTATGVDAAGEKLFAVAAPIMQGETLMGSVAVASAAGEIDSLVRKEREQVLQMFVIAILVSIGLSLVLASTIANPLSDLAAAAEIGRDRNVRKLAPGRVRIPDLTGRPDEIGRLSGALRGMVAALYDRIEANEQFAADVAHEIKNPLASLRSAVGTMRVAKREDQREKLLDVIDHDVRRLDRLVSDISNASRLDSELVKEEEDQFDLLHMLTNLTDYLGQEAASKGVEFITDLPRQPIMVYGLEARLAQVFVNLITNAISFCEEGDAVRVWVRKRDNRVLVVFEDTGPGIPEQALTKIFNRFYSERPPGQFGDHSGLGLAISKQIVEAHGGVIWAENIRPTEADITSEPLGARFVVGLPI